jgi:hypothetical protein
MVDQPNNGWTKQWLDQTMVDRMGRFCLIGEGESLLFPVPTDQFPVRVRTIPCSNWQGIGVDDVETAV